MVATARTRPQEAFLEQSRTVLGWLQGLPAETFDRRNGIAGLDRTGAHRASRPRACRLPGIAGSADQRRCAPDL